MKIVARFQAQTNAFDYDCNLLQIEEGAFMVQSNRSEREKVAPYREIYRKRFLDLKEAWDFFYAEWQGSRPFVTHSYLPYLPGINT